MKTTPLFRVFRLQNRMNLQLCFINNSESEEEDEDEGVQQVRIQGDSRHEEM